MSPYPVGSSERPLRVAVVGAGPAGFYTADALLKQKKIVAEVDLFDRLPAPFGLVRFGVAPDHQKIKSVIKAYEKTADNARFRFLGNVGVCEAHVSAFDLLAHYDQVVFTVGCGTDRHMGIGGEDLRGSHAATSFVAWYNGHPEFQQYEVSLDTDRAVVVGIGDVAMDIARMLLNSIDELAKTDIADGALEVFRGNRVREVVLLARRGPAQAAFATKELDDIAQMANVDVIVDPETMRIPEEEFASLDGLTKRKVEFLRGVADKQPAQGGKRLVLRFFASPAEILGDNGKVVGIKIERTRLVRSADGNMSARGTGEFETLPAGLVFRAVGYRGVPLCDVPFDERNGIIPNAEGRVLREGQTWPRVYVAGWIKRGPTGVIGTNKGDAAATVEKMVEDLAGWQEPVSEQKTRAAVDKLLAERGVRVVTFADWKKIDAAEVIAGQKLGRVRRKLTTLKEMLSILDE